MFITNGKSLFGNTGLIISLLILIILVYFSYNKCYLNNIDGFNCNVPTDSDYPCTTSANVPLIVPSPQRVRIKISGNSLLINFTIDITKNIPKSFIIVLAQYDINKNNTGNNKFYLSNETILNPNLTSLPTINQSSIQIPIQKNLCTIVNGVAQCQYSFLNLDIKDINGNLYYYKLGVSAIYNNINSPYVTPYNINNINKMFTLENSIDTQNQKDTCVQSQISANTYSDTISTADGQYELIKSQLGNYPDNLFLESQTTNDGSLSDLIDKSMAQALLNVNVSTNLPTNPL